MFMLTAQRQIPRLLVASPKDEQQLRSLVRTALAQDHPFALHYPRDSVVGVPEVAPTILPVGVSEVLEEGNQIAIFAFGPIIQRVAPIAARLRAEGISVALVNAIWASPLDHTTVRRYGESADLIVTVEESVEAGGFGGAVVESLAAHEAATGRRVKASIATIGIPAGSFVDHGSVSDLRTLIGLDEAGIERRIRAAWSARNQ
jgi:1-deoxy-D-xylulose-5-phosphate synthase